MLRDTLSVRSMIATAGLATALFAGTVNGQANSPLPATAAEAGLTASAKLDRAADLLAAGKAIRARALLASIAGGDQVTLTEAERTRLSRLMSNANTRLKSLTPIQTSLETAEDALERDDLVTLEKHARAVADAPKASNEQAMKARDLLARAGARRAAIAPTIGEALDRAAADFEAGRVEAARMSLDGIARAGVALTPEQADRLALYQTRVVDASAGMMQPGVIKKREKTPEQPAQPAAPAPAQPAAPAPAQPAAPAPAQPAAPAPAQPAAPAPAQPAAPAPAQPANAGNQPTAWQADPAQPAAAQPAAPAQPAAAQPAAPAQPASSGQPADPIQAARRFEAQSILAEADRAYDEARMREAADKYDRLLREFATELEGGNRSHAEQRLAEARLRLNVNPGQGGTLLQNVIEQNSIQKQQLMAEFNNDLEQARRSLESGEPGRARDLAAAANLKLSSGRNLLSASEFESLRGQVDTLRSEIDKREDAIRAQQAAEREEQIRRETEAATRLAQQTKESKISESISRVRALQEEMKYREALQVVEDNILFLDPINPTGLVLRDVLRDLIVFNGAQAAIDKRQERIADHQVENLNAMIPPLNILDYPEDWPRITSLRGEPIAFNDTEENRRALAVLDSKRVPVNFNDTPLPAVIEFVRAVTNLNVDVDWQSLENAGISRDQPVTLNLTNVPMRTVLDRVVEKVSPEVTGLNGAAWSMNDGVLTVASREVINKNKPLVMYDVRDLLVEIPNYTNAPEFDLQSVLQSSQGGGGGQSPFRDTNTQAPPRRSLEDRTNDIIQIITNNVDPQGWRENGGDVGFIQQLQGSLIITNTPANHRAIHGLLSQLRAQRAMQINVETRFLLVATDFFEQIGVDIDVYFNARNNQVRTARATRPQTRASDFFDFTRGGLQPTYPQTGAGSGTNVTPLPSPLSPIGGGQNSLGLAEDLVDGDFARGILGSGPALGVAGQFLDDIQVDFLVKATQADRRTVSLTAPRLTFTNGQTSNIIVATQLAFVSDLQPVVSESAVGFDPTLATLSEGVSLVVDGTVSSDRRYVTLNVRAAVSDVVSFSERPVTAVAGGQLVNSQQTQSSIQLPTVTVTRVETTVTVPDQGTILLGGQRLVSEQEVESGVPVLSKIPILNRFFTNRVTSKEEQTLLILIKPTVLIQNEEEERNFPGLGQSISFGG